MDVVRRIMGMLVVVVAVIFWTDVLELVDRAALWTTLDRAFSGGDQPESAVAVCGRAGTADVLLVTKASDYDGILESSCRSVVSHLS